MSWRQQSKGEMSIEPKATSSADDKLAAKFKFYPDAVSAKGAFFNGDNNLSQRPNLRLNKTHSILLAKKARTANEK